MTTTPPSAEERACAICDRHLSTKRHRVEDPTKEGLLVHVQTVEQAISDAIHAAQQVARLEERERRESCWNEINKLIKSGELPKPKHSERNGLILAANLICPHVEQVRALANDVKGEGNG